MAVINNMAVMKKEHTYPPYEHNFDKLCDAGCGRPVPYGVDRLRLMKIGWVIESSDEYADGKRRICPVCVDEGKT